MYYPKTLQRFAPKQEEPLSLMSICLDATLQLLTNANTSERDARAKKTIRKYVDSCLAQTIQLDILARAVKKWYGADKMIRLLEMFEPFRTVHMDVNLIGNFRYAYGCYFVNNRLYWSNGTIERLNLNFSECEKLYSILVWGCPGSLKSIAVSTEQLALKHSRLPSIIARAQVLSSVTILNGATDHILRILGLNCPVLQRIDVSHSSGVTNSGMRGLLLRHPRNKNSIEVNECANSLNRLILLGTDVTRLGFEFVCRNLGFGYSISFLPDTMIFRQKKDNLKVQCFEIDSATKPMSSLGFTETATRGLEQIVRRYVDLALNAGIVETSLVMDLFEDRQFPSLFDIFVRDPASFIVLGYCRIEGKSITKLILPWDHFVWRLASLPDLTDLGTELPNLKVLKTRIKGKWDKNDALLPKLEESQIWTINDSTIMSFLTHSPIIKTFMFNSLNFNNTGGEAPWNLKMDDTSVQQALNANESLRHSIEEFSIRPAPKLTSSTVIYLTTKCPNLKRLGDMESWNLTSDQIKQCNKRLDETNSRCVLTVLSFPPKDKPDYLM